MHKLFRSIKQHRISILFILLLYISNDTILFGTNSNQTFLFIHYAFIVLMFIVFAIITIKKRTINAKLIIIFMLLLLLSIMTMIFKDIFSIKYFYEIVLILLSIMIVEKISLEDFQIEFVNAMTVVAILSFIPFLINIVYQPLLKYFPTVINSTGYSYNNLIIGIVPHNTYLFNVYRNFSFFREPGIYGCFLNIALIFALYSINGKSNNKKIIVLIAAILSTMSTGSILGMFLILSIYLIVSKMNSKKLLLLFAMIIFTLLFFYSDYLNNVVFGKLNTNNASYYSRMASVTSNVEISLNNPILGVGWERIETEYESVSIRRYGLAVTHGEKNYHNTNTIFKILSIHGYLFFIIYAKGLYNFFRKVTDKKIVSIILLITLTIILSYEDLSLNIIIPMIVFYGLSNNKLLRGKRYENS